MASRLILGQRIATGGMAEVFEARLVGEQGFAKEVVVKRVLPHLANNKDFIARFLNEAKLAAQLSHAGIVQVLELVVDGGDALMVMEPVDGADLSTLLKRLRAQDRRVPLAVALRIASGVASALAYAHEKTGSDGKPLGIVHRDVTPSNVLVSRDGATKLIDFGIARAHSVARMTVRGCIVGKTHHVSPEQVRDEELDARSDVWACGVILFELLAGKRPFVGPSDSVIFQRIVDGERADVRELCDVPEALARIVDGALMPNKRERTASARAMAHAIDEVIAREGLYASSDALGALVRELVPRAQPVRIDGRTGTEPATLSVVSDLDSDLADTSPARKQRGAPTLTLDSEGDDEATTRLLAGASPSTVDLTTRSYAIPSTTFADAVDSRERTTRTFAPRDVTSEDTRERERDDVEPTVLLTRSVRAVRRSGVRASRVRVASAAGAALVVCALGAWSAFADGDEVDVDVVVAPAVVAPIASAPVTTTIEGDVAVAAEQRDVEPVLAKRAPKRSATRKVAVDVASEPGVLVVDSRPWSRVTVDGVDLGVTPVAPRTLSAGAHTVVLVNDQQGLKKTVSVVVKSGEKRIERVDLRR